MTKIAMLKNTACCALFCLKGQEYLVPEDVPCDWAERWVQNKIAEWVIKPQAPAESLPGPDIDAPFADKTWKELTELCKEQGVHWVGKRKEELIELLQGGGDDAD